MSPIHPVLALALIVILVAALYRPMLACQGFCLAAPLGLASVPGNLQLVTALALVLIVLAVMERLLSGNGPFRLDAATILGMCWCIGVVVSVMRSTDWTHSIIFGVWQVVVVLLALAWRELVGRRDRLAPVLTAWLIGAALVAFSGLVLSRSGLDSAYGGSVITGRPVGVFSQPNEYGTYCMLLGIFAFGIAVQTKRGVRWVAVVATLGSLVGMLLSLSRGAWLGAIAGLVILVVVAPRSRRPLGVALGLGAVVAVGFLVVAPGSSAVAIIVQRAASIANPASNPYDQRPALMAEGLRQWTTSPWFGVGPNVYPEISTNVTAATFPDGGEHPHNFVLAVAAEQGLVGLAAVAGLAIVIVANAIAVLPIVRSKPGSHSPSTLLAAGVTVSAAAALGAFAVEGLVDYPMRNALARTTVWLMVGWVLAGYAALAGSSPSRFVLGRRPVSAPTAVAEVPEVRR